MAELSTVTFGAETDAFGGTEIHLAEVKLAEALDEPYAAEITLRVHDANADVLELLGRDIVLKFVRGESERRICGIVGSVWEDEPGTDYVTARAIVHPALFMLSMRRDTRIFQEKSVPEIVEAVLSEALSEYGRSVEVDLGAEYPTREYCVQYQETDLAFVQRLLQEEGIFYSFDHEGEKEVLVLRDSSAQFARAPSSADPIVFQPHNLQVGSEERIKAFARRHDHGTTSVSLRDFDWSAATPIVEDEERGEDAAGRDRESYEHGAARSLTLHSYDAGARSYQKNDAGTQKVTRNEELRQNEIVGVGLSSVIGLAPGTTFQIVGHPLVGLDGEYYVTRVWHTAQPSTEQDDDRYENRFECRPIDVAHRPARRFAKTTIASIQTAIVTGPSGEEIHTDEHGRIKVQFYWDRENPADETSSCWVRCEQSWSGNAWGFFWLPRIGMEVVVHFVDGDPDRPLVTGCVYNGTNATPYALPDEKTKSTIKSNSSPGGGGSNELRFEDKAGSEEIYAHAQKDYNEIVLNDHTTTVHHDQKNEVDNDQTQTVKNNQTETVHGDQKMTVGANRTVHVKGNYDESIDGTESHHVVGAVSETFSATETRTVGANLDETIVGAETRTITGTKTETVSGSHTLDVGAASTRTVSGSLTQDVAGGITETAPPGYTINVSAAMNVTTTGPTNWTAPGGIKLVAPGGVTWVDFNDAWFGAHIIKFGPTKYEDYIFKAEMCASNCIDLFAVKFEQAGLQVGNAGIKLTNEAGKMDTAGVDAQMGGLRKFVGGLISRGG